MNDLTPALTLRSLDVDVVQPGTAVRRGRTPCEIETHVRFDTSALESFASRNWRPDVYDALLVAAAVEFCDRKLTRHAHAWGRSFKVRVPVHSPALWNSRGVSQSLISALELVTGDAWSFEFVERAPATQSVQQTRMEFPRDVGSVIAYSDGMDSRAVAGIEERQLGDRLVRVRVGKKLSDIRGNDHRKRPFARIPYRVLLHANNGETSARSRGFKFGLVAGVAAFLVDAPEVIVPESGQGALAPVMIPVGQGHPDYRNHPVFTTKIAKLIGAIFGHEVTYRFPRLWHTKAQTLRKYVDLHGDRAAWQDTRSCWQQARQVSVAHVWRQCGICAACMLRRMSVHAAGLTEARDIYVWEDLGVSDFTSGAAGSFGGRNRNSLREYALAGALHLDDFAALDGSAEGELIVRRAQGEVSRATGIAVAEAADGLRALIKQHNKEWTSFSESLGDSSFVNSWTDRS
ncbi:7-cyano-7-deazaguanine synthase [Tianweitania sp.]|uniref:7-cyano-7-deazaguanine synthase n=1 Tax=Tianweitania sp. TaxID=2021634 RepID=UPI00289AEAA5|nr:7-cyano-7-deazaguanine synthase [Tianweitania sp.]